MKVLFLDVDGVLNNDVTTDKTPGGFTGVSYVLVERLQQIIKSTHAKIVLSSTWKEEWNKDINLCTVEGLYLMEKLNEYDLSICDKIEDGISFYRGKQIKSYLNSHSDIMSYVILDDLEFDFDDYDDLKHHFVQTQERIGLTDKNVEDAISILNEGGHK